MRYWAGRDLYLGRLDAKDLIVRVIRGSDESGSRFLPLFVSPPLLNSAVANVCRREWKVNPWSNSPPRLSRSCLPRVSARSPFRAMDLAR